MTLDLLTTDGLALVPDGRGGLTLSVRVSVTVPMPDQPERAWRDAGHALAQALLIAGQQPLGDDLRGVYERGLGPRRMRR